MSLVQQPRTLSIFCDGSLHKSKEEIIGCAGALPVYHIGDKGTPMRLSPNTQILRTSTNNETEITAIYLGILVALEFIHENTIYANKINLYSDSKISVFGLREWMFNWVKCVKGDELYSSSGTPVANQHIFKLIVQLIVTNNLNITFYHQKGHVNSEKDLINAMRVFNESNNTNIRDIEIIKELSKYNNDIDGYTREVVNDFAKNNIVGAYEKLESPIQFNTLNNVNMYQYKRLINKIRG